ncbi:MAG: hypothetical protein NC089_10865 [Bacteroides sp.]|nr:hypothetical protein [Bacteroides sp.]MCM1551030.1 hypothetical protein [Clostridium sp.]
MMQFYYVTDYSIPLCLDYMKHENAYDRFIYQWEERNGYFLITFLEYKNDIKSLATSPKPTFKVVFEELEHQIGINVQFLGGFLQPLPFVYTKEVDWFWEKKLDAKKIR